MDTRVYLVVVLLFILQAYFYFVKLNNYLKDINDLKMMFNRDELKKLKKDSLIDRILELENKVKRTIILTVFSSAVSIVLGIILISINIAPVFCGIEVVDGGQDIVRHLYEPDEGTWKIEFKTTGFIPTKNIILHVKFSHITTEVDYDSVFFSVVPDEVKLQKNNEFEYKWNQYKGEIIVHMEVSNHVLIEMDNTTYVWISTDNGMEYVWGF